MKTLQRMSCYVLVTMLLLATGCDDGAKSSSDLILSSETSTASRENGNRYWGLQCVSWKKLEQEQLQITLHNAVVPGGSGEWELDGTIISESVIGLKSKWHNCIISGSGADAIDLIYVLDTKNLDTTKPLEVNFDLELCPDLKLEKTQYETRIEVEKAKEGAICRYCEHPESFEEIYQIVPDKLPTESIHGACECEEYNENSSKCDKWRDCGDRLNCHRVKTTDDDRYGVCLHECNSDDKCPLEGLLKCVDGLCELERSWD